MPFTSGQKLSVSWVLILVWALSSAPVSAEAWSLAQNVYVCNTYPCSPPSKIPVFDDRVFDFGDTTPQTSVNIGGKKYYIDSTESKGGNPREAWLNACASAKDESMSRFRRCFEREKLKSIRDLNDRQDEINRKRNTPLRNSSR